jgi:hypothetical protein
MMIKKSVFLALVFVMLAAFTCAAYAADVAFTDLPDASFIGVKAVPTNSAVLVDGVAKAFDSYNINNFNYFKLRDIAFVMNGTGRQFAVDWDAAENAIKLVSGSAYAATGDEMSSKGSETKTAAASAQKVIVDSKSIRPEVYNIDGYNYFKLRDLGIALDIGIGWDGDSNTITLESTKGYVESQTVDELGKAVGDAILESNKGKFGGGDFSTQAHIVLETANNGDSTTVYAVALYMEYKKSGDKFEEAGGISAPAAITFKTGASGQRTLEEYWEPDNGEGYQSSILKKFPKNLHDRTDMQFYIKALQSSTVAQATEHYK